ncbi:hypothetical protein PV327_008616 [Microctonus hyperodae]|uniref:Mitochondrial ribosomal protein S34 n=1 Tax=Microctonus hyperodae TaxID=165561 RepID=A0AA39KHM8_MICHY|nr:hypothetical protein PV327_008616 [Microctonus hyperodae]
MRYELIGRKTTFKGKSLWEILGNLKNYGVGRIVIRQRFQRYPEPCYLRIVKVGTLPQPPKEPYELTKINKPLDRTVQVLVEDVFRGRKFRDLVHLEETTYKTDYQLIPKDEEYKYTIDKKKDDIILPRTMELPPLLREIIIRNMKAKGQEDTEEPQLPLVYNLKGNKCSRIAEEGEKPTVTFEMGLGKPALPHLYANVKPI